MPPGFVTVSLVSCQAYAAHAHRLRLVPANGTPNRTAPASGGLAVPVRASHLAARTSLAHATSRPLAHLPVPSCRPSCVPALSSSPWLRPLLSTSPGRPIAAAPAPYPPRSRTSRSRSFRTPPTHPHPGACRQEGGVQRRASWGPVAVTASVGPPHRTLPARRNERPGWR